MERVKRKEEGERMNTKADLRRCLMHYTNHKNLLSTLVVRIERRLSVTNLSLELPNLARSNLHRPLTSNDVYPR